MPGHAYGAASESEVAAIAAAEAQTADATLAEQVRARGVEVERSASARRRRRASACSRTASPRCGRATTSTSTARRSALGAATWDDCALTVLARVVSTPGRRPDHPRLRQQDADERPRARISAVAGYGVVFDDLGTQRAGRHARGRAAVRRACERAGARIDGLRRLKPGDLVRVVPNHSCVVSNLVDGVGRVDGQRGRRPSSTIAARGRIA